MNPAAASLGDSASASNMVWDAQTLLQEELRAGLRAPFASIAPKFFYDELGSKLFEAICQLPEYYLTRSEAAIFARHGAEIARLVSSGRSLIDLGAGNCAKAAALFPLLHPVHYVAVDISVDFLCDAVHKLRQAFPYIEMTALGQDFSQHLQLPATVDESRRLFFYPGSSIGNFSPDQALALLRQLRAQCRLDGGLLIGVDLVKDASVLDAAYDDALGVTAAFNLNVLRHVNRLLKADFDLRQWRHLAFFNAAAGRVEMHLQARQALRVSWAGAQGREQREFLAGHCIHTENSYKYRPQDFTALLRRARFQTEKIWLDPDEGFALFYANATGDE